MAKGLESTSLLGIGSSRSKRPIPAPEENLEVLKSVAKNERLKSSAKREQVKSAVTINDPTKRRPSVTDKNKSSSSLQSAILDYVDLPEMDFEKKKKPRKSRRHICHSVVVVGLVTLIVYLIFMTLFIGYFHVPKIKEILDSLKRLANIKEWLRIIFKPWYNSGKTGSGGGRGETSDDGEESHHVGTYLNPEFDVYV